MTVFVLDRRGRPLMPCTEKRARLLLARGRARVHRVMPFVIRLVDRTVQGSVLQPLRLKLDPGSRVSGVALVREAAEGQAAVLNLLELIHRGAEIRAALAARRGFRRRRRGNLRYRAPRFANRRRPAGWLAPSLQHRVDTVMAWVERLRRWAPLTGLGMELARFDTQALEQPDIEGLAYQQGTLAGCEVREYLLDKWGRRCAYCDAQDLPLQIEHLVARARGGTGRVSNLTLACRRCTEAKGTQPIEQFLAAEPERLARLLAQARRPLKDAAAVNSTRSALHQALVATSLPVEAASGGRTKWNRARLGVPKSHALDAACVGRIEGLRDWRRPTLSIRCAGRGTYQRTRLDRHGFPRGYLTRVKRHFGFQTGDRVRAVVPTGRQAGVHTGRVAVRASGSFNVQTLAGVVQGVSHRHCRLIQRGDGYGYSHLPKEEARAGNGAAHRALSLPGLNAGVSRAYW